VARPRQDVPLEPGRLWFQEKKACDLGEAYYIAVHPMYVTHQYAIMHKHLPAILAIRPSQVTGEGDMTWLKSQADNPQTFHMKIILWNKIFKKHSLAGPIMDLLRDGPPLIESQIKEVLEERLKRKISDSTLGNTLRDMGKCKPPMIRNQKAGKDRGYRLAT
jgi:hypothetical protein